MMSVDIYGRRYNIGGEHDPETLRTLAGYVDRRMRQMAAQVKTGDDVGIAVLAALNIADDYYRTRRALEQREDEIEQRVRGLSARLHAALEPLNNASGTAPE